MWLASRRNDSGRSSTSRNKTCGPRKADGTCCTSANLVQEPLQRLAGAQATISGVGERRFIDGILGSFTRTAAFRMNTRTPRMEPEEVAAAGVVGLHYCAGPGTPPRLVQVIGDEPGWRAADLDELTGKLTALTVTGGNQAWPMPDSIGGQGIGRAGTFHHALPCRRPCGNEETKH